VGKPEMKTQAVIRLNFSSEKQLKVMLEALKPETRTRPTHRSKVQIMSEANSLTLNFEATDTSALRAAINSYLRFTSLVSNVLRLIENAENRIK
jgi:tRNA threonylcarbamoyladenosine modification (KEOPS) complex  Pcc1 subunit